MDIIDTIEAKSDQINARDLIGGPITVTVAGVDVDPRKQQPVDIHLVEKPGKAYRPNKGMRTALVACWGKKSADYAGKRLTLYFDPETMFKGDKVGGIKISHASDIDKPVRVTLLVARNPKPHEILPLPPPPPIPTFATVDEARAYYGQRQSEGASPTELTAIRNAAPTQKENHA